MPSKSKNQRNYIFYLRGKYKNKSNTPKDQAWIWDSGWNEIEEDKNDSVYAYSPKIERYKRKYIEDYKFDQKPESELADFEFAIILPTGERLFRMDTENTAQISINKLALDLTQEQYNQAMQKIKMKYPGIEIKQKKDITTSSEK